MSESRANPPTGWLDTQSRRSVRGGGGGAGVLIDEAHEAAAMQRRHVVVRATRAGQQRHADLVGACTALCESCAGVSCREAGEL